MYGRGLQEYGTKTEPIVLGHHINLIGVPYFLVALYRPGAPHSFSEPIIIPLTKYRWANGYMSRIGRLPTTISEYFIDV